MYWSKTHFINKFEFSGIYHQIKISTYQQKDRRGEESIIVLKNESFKREHVRNVLSLSSCCCCCTVANISTAGPSKQLNVLINVIYIDICFMDDMPLRLVHTTAANWVQTTLLLLLFFINYFRSAIKVFQEFTILALSSSRLPKMEPNKRRVK